MAFQYRPVFLCSFWSLQYNKQLSGTKGNTLFTELQFLIPIKLSRYLLYATRFFLAASASAFV